MHYEGVSVLKLAGTTKINTEAPRIRTGDSGKLYLKCNETFIVSQHYAEHPHLLLRASTFLNGRRSTRYLFKNNKHCDIKSAHQTSTVPINCLQDSALQDTQIV